MDEPIVRTTTTTTTTTTATTTTTTTTTAAGDLTGDRMAAARYPALFYPSGSRVQRLGYRRIERLGTGIVSLTVLHGDLTPRELDAIGEYRLQQYVLAGMYDAATVERLGLRRDPAVEALADQDVHIAIGDVEGRFLCYMCMQSPLLPVGAQAREASAAGWRMGDTARLFVFPCESEFGVGMYAGHPQIAPIPLDNVRELTRLVRNQAVRTSIDGYTVVEAVLAVARRMIDPTYHVDAIVGCASLEVRRLLYRLGIPMVYAPFEPIRGDNLGAAQGGQLLWTDQAHVPGRFWPFALSSADVRLDVAYFDALDVALALPADQILESMGALRPDGLLRTSRLLVPPDVAYGIVWTDNTLPASAI
jgi:hypothetical protein